MNRPRLAIFRPLAWLTLLLFLAASAVAPGVARWEPPAVNRDGRSTLAATPVQPSPLLATHVFTANAAPLPPLWRDLDPALPAPALRQIAAPTFLAWNRTAKSPGPSSHERTTLVGVVEFRI